MSKNKAFTTVCMLQVCGKFILKQLSRLMQIQCNQVLLKSISKHFSIWGKFAAMHAVYLLKAFSDKASKKSNGSSIWNNKNTDKFFTLIPDLLGVHVLFDCEQRHLFRITITHDFDDDKVHYRELNNSTLFK